MGISRDTWAQLCVAIFGLSFASGVAAMIAGYGFRYAGHNATGDAWVLYGWIGITIGLLGLVVGFFVLYATRPKNRSESRSRITRIWRFFKGIRLITLDNPRESIDPEERVRLVDQINAISAERDRALDEKWHREDEAREAIAERDRLIAQCDDLAGRLDVMEKDGLNHLTQNLELVRQVESLRKKAAWAQTLIDAARDREPFMLVRPKAWLAWDTAENLKKPEPAFDLHLALEYHGVHRLIIGERVSGFLARWNGDKFNHEPILSVDDNLPPPYDRIGQAYIKLRFHQRISRESADGILGALRQYAGAASAINFDASGLQISVRTLSAVDDEVLYDGHLLLGSELTTAYTLHEE